jgi:hypothetical protein
MNCVIKKNQTIHYMHRRLLSFSLLFLALGNIVYGQTPLQPPEIIMEGRDMVCFFVRAGSQYGEAVKISTPASGGTGNYKYELEMYFRPKLVAGSCNEYCWYTYDFDVQWSWSSYQDPEDPDNSCDCEMKGDSILFRVKVTDDDGAVARSNIVKIIALPRPIMDNVESQSVCSGAYMEPTNFTTTIDYNPAVTYSWESDDDYNSAGLSNKSGEGNIEGFKAENSTVDPIVMTITVTPKIKSCTGTSKKTFTLTVNPEPVVEDVPDRTVCNGETVNIPITGKATKYVVETVSSTVSNINPEKKTIPADPDGSATLDFGVLTNTGSSPQNAEIKITPYYDDCSGTEKTFNIKVNPAVPTVNNIPPQTICSGKTANALVFSMTGTTDLDVTYSWSAGDNFAVAGLASQTGKGGTVTFGEAVNSGTTPIQVTVTVTTETGDCTGESKNFTITVNPIPELTSSTTLPICSETPFTYTATSSVSGTNFNWVREIVTGIAEDTKNGTGKDISEILTNTTKNPVDIIYKISLVANGCANTQNVNGTVNHLPTAPVAKNVTVSYDGNDHTADATVETGQTIVWYKEATGTEKADRPSLSGNIKEGEITTYAAAQDNNTGCESARTPVTVKVTEFPAAPEIDNITVCYDGKEHTVEATNSPGETIVWYRYEDETEKETVPAPNITEVGTKTAYAAAINDVTGNESERVKVTVTVNALPNVPTVDNTVECYDGKEHTAKVTFGTEESIIWYEDDNGTTETTVPALTEMGTITAYAVTRNNNTGCESAQRIPVTVTVNSINATFEVRPPLCNGGTGEIEIKVNAAEAPYNVVGTPPYMYRINDGENDKDYQDEDNPFSVPVKAGTYSVKIRDDKGCISILTGITVTEPAVIYYSDIRLSICPSIDPPINLLKYLDPVDSQSSILWDSPFIESDGQLINSKYRIPGMYTLIYEARSDCFDAPMRRKVYIRTLHNNELPRTNNSTITVCYKFAETLNINQLIGIESGGTLTCNDDHAAEYITEAPNGGMIFDGKKYYEDVDPADNSTTVTFTYTPSGCLSDKTYNLVIVLTSLL